jgi:tRNA(Met) C34 N-acetyltransferase TmcA
MRAQFISPNYRWVMRNQSGLRYKLIRKLANILENIDIATYNSLLRNKRPQLSFNKIINDRLRILTKKKGIIEATK